MSMGIEGFGPAARRAIKAAGEVAAELGTSRVGTEHLLLGVLAVGSCAGAARLREAGAGRSAVLRKVGETSMGSAADPAAPATRSPRAERALNRAHRFAHDRRSPEARSEHLLLGILDVEGTAGQVLRGLGADLDVLRAAGSGATVGEDSMALADDVAVGAVPDSRSGPYVPPPSCTACSNPLEDAIQFTVLTATDSEQRKRDVIVVSCRACGAAVGIAR